MYRILKCPRFRAPPVKARCFIPFFLQFFSFCLHSTLKFTFFSYVGCTLSINLRRCNLEVFYKPVIKYKIWEFVT